MALRFCQRAQGLAHPHRRSSKTQFSRPASADVPIEPLRLGYHLETAFGVADRFRIAEKKNAPLAQRKVKKRNNFRLRLVSQIDQKIAA